MLTPNQPNNFYLYGMTMPGRNGSIGSKYRYAFNGMETDGEVSGNRNSYTTQFRQYDPRLGRWKSLDPKAYHFPWQSPYNSMNLDPINNNDVKGDSIGVRKEDKARMVANDLNAFYKHFYGVDEAFKVVRVNSYTVPGETWAYYWDVGDPDPYSAPEVVNQEMYAIVPNRALVREDGTSFWDTDEYTRQIYELSMYQGMEEIDFDEDSPGTTYGNSNKDGSVTLYLAQIEKFAETDPSLIGDTWTVAGVLLHEFTYHKHPSSFNGDGRALQRYYGIPLSPADNDKTAPDGTYYPDQDPHDPGKKGGANRVSPLILDYNDDWEAFQNSNKIYPGSDGKLITVKDDAAGQTGKRTSPPKGKTATRQKTPTYRPKFNN